MKPIKEIKPVRDVVLIRPLKAEEVTSGGIILPPTAQEKNTKGEILGIGKDVPDEVKKGDIVLFGQYSGTELTMSKKDYILVPYKNLLAVL